MQGLEQKTSSARQLGEMAKILQREAEEKAVKRMGAEAQIESIKILADQREKLEVMREAIIALLKHNLEQAKIQIIASQERDRIETERYQENLQFTKIAAWTGIVGTVLAVGGIVLQFIL